MKNKAVFLDRDGTINVDKNYLYRIDEFEYLPDVKEALLSLQNMGYMLIIITNQSGIARGIYSEDDYKKLENWLKKDLEKEGIYISGSYYCPHLATAPIFEYSKECNCRKPKIGMFLQAVKDFDIDLSKSFAIGDKDRDVSICRSPLAVGMLGYVIYSTEETNVGQITKITGGLNEAVCRIREITNEQ